MKTIPGSPGRGRTLALAALVLTGACATARERPFDAPAGSLAANVLLVTNRGWSDVVVYQADGSTPVRLGWVPALRSSRLAIQRGSGPLRLVLRPSASSEAFVAEPVWVTPGQVVHLTVHPMLGASELTVR